MYFHRGVTSLVKKPRPTLVVRRCITKRGIRKTILKMKEKEGLPFAEETTLNFTEDQIIEITKKSGTESRL